MSKRTGKVCVLDGGMGSLLESKGYPLNESELWAASLLQTNPDALLEAHEAYYKAGADICISATYQASNRGLQRCFGLDKEQSTKLFHKALELVDRARKRLESGNNRLVAAGLGSYGAILTDGSEFTGKFGISEQELADFHSERLAQVLCGEVVPDIIIFETIPSLQEARAILQAVSTHGKGRRVWISFTGKENGQIGSGDSFAEAVKLVDEDENIEAISINCTSPKFISELLDIANRNTTKPIAIYPNRGESWDREKRAWVPNSGHEDEEFLALAEEWLGKGVKYIGGCCRTNPETISKIAKLVKDFDSQG